jgi:hypothetical protein
MVSTSEDRSENDRPRVVTSGKEGIARFWRRHRAVFEIVRWVLNILFLTYRVFRH